MRLYGLVRHRSLRPPLCRVVDGRALAGIDDDAWDQMVSAVSSQAESLRPAFERQAIIVAPGIAGARTAALLPALGPGDACRVFVDPDEAYRFVDPIDGPLAKASVDALVASVTSIRIVEARARAWVAGNLRAADVGVCAASLGMSTRTLQRKLRELGSSYRALVADERVAAARAQLEDGDAKVEAIARAIGCSSASQLGVLLRRAGHASPSALRAAQRQRPVDGDDIDTLRGGKLPRPVEMATKEAMEAAEAEGDRKRPASIVAPLGKKDPSPEPA